MKNQERARFILKKDRYVNTRDGNSHFLNLFCSKCNQQFAVYQKDGHGKLIRVYLDRIFAPEELVLLVSKAEDKSSIPNLKCSGCNALIGTPMVYEEEKRLAFRLIHGSFIKKKS